MIVLIRYKHWEKHPQGGIKTKAKKALKTFNGSTAQQPNRTDAPSESSAL
ncbi:MAG: hypothetical protein ACI9A7_001621 [Cyclobacteriaceae bacterium]|jgi:hypothetical protein